MRQRGAPSSAPISGNTMRCTRFFSMLKGLPVTKQRPPVSSCSDRTPPDPIPLLRPHYEPSPLLRIGPPQCSAPVLSPRGFGRLYFSLSIGATGSGSSVRKPASASRPLYAGRRPPPSSGSWRTCPREDSRPWFGRRLDSLRRVLEGFTYVRLSDAHLQGSMPLLFSNAHHHGSLPQQLRVVWDPLLKADPEGPALIFRTALRHRS
jgi:hypothetical protein